MEEGKRGRGEAVVFAAFLWGEERQGLEPPPLPREGLQGKP